jgi:peptidase M28-like protein
LTVREDIAALAAMTRGSAGEGERASARWIAERLSAIGVDDVAIEPYRAPRTYAWAHLAHALAGVVAARRGSAALALATLASYELEVSGRRPWVRRLLPRGTGDNVVALLPAHGPRRRTLVLVAHHDAAQTGLMWRHPWLAGLQWSRDEVPPFAAGSELGFLLVALGRRRAGAALLAVSLLGALDVARSPTVPGASDNATGVAAVLALAERYAREPLDGTEVIVLIPGCEESGMGGMAAWMRSPEARGLDPATTLVLGLDTLGAGEPVVLAAEGPPRRQRYRAADLAWADRGAALAGLPEPRRFTIGGWTDPVLALMAGLPTISLLSVRDGGFTNYHLPTDTPDRVDWDSVEKCLRLAAGTAEAFSS